MKHNPVARKYPLYIVVLIFFVTSCSEAQIPDSFKLPKKLREISGLTHDQDDRVFALNDEKGIVYEVDLKAGDVRTVTKIRKDNGKVVKADFEGLAYLNNTFYLVTSKGMLYSANMPPIEESTTNQSEVVDIGLSEVCEIEGLSAYDDLLYLVCKTNYRKTDIGYVLIYAYNLATDETSLYLRVPYNKLNRKKLNPSGIVVTGNEIYLVSAIQGVLTRLDRKGNFIRDLELDKKLHRQTEGISVLESGALVLADEGKRKHGRISVYTPR